MSHSVVMLHDAPQPEEGGVLRMWIGRIPSWLPLLIAWIPTITWFVKRLDDGNDEALGLLALALATVLTWRDRISFRPNSAARTGGALLLFLSVASIGVLPPMIRAVLAVLGTGAWIGMLGKPSLLGLFVLSLPVVASLQFYIGWPMRLAASEGVVRLLELGGVVIARHGVNIEVGGVHVGVDSSCGGILMLWHAMAAAMALASWHRLSPKSTFISAGMAFLLVIPANILRMTWLVIEQSGRVPPSGISHGNIGLICFLAVLLPLWWWSCKHARPHGAPAVVTVSGNPEKLILILTAMMTPWMMLRSITHEIPPQSTAAPESFTFNGVTAPLTQLTPSPVEAAFQTSFPGSLTSHRWGDGQVILRRVTEATRKLHPSRDCLRAAGFETTHAVTARCADGSEWSRFTATKKGETWVVHERIVSEQDGSVWADVPAWYWSALAYPLNGPWRAETVISR